MRRHHTAKDRPTLESARQLALDALLFLAQDSQRIAAFLNNSGMAADDLRTRARDDGTLTAVLEHLLGNESLLLVFAAHSRHPPEAVHLALARLDSDGDTT